MGLPDDETMKSRAESILAAIFDPTLERSRRFLAPVWIIGLYLLGVYFWGSFFSWGRFPMNFEDWTVITAPRLDAIRDGFQYGQLPLHLYDAPSLHKYTDRFFTSPDIVTTPQMILLRFIDIDTFVVVDVLLEFSISTLGLLWLRRHFNLSLAAWTVMYVMFSFNGYIQSHYAVGHFSWGGYFIFPLFFALLMRLFQGQGGWRWVLQIALVLFYIVLAGSEHHFLWLLLLLGLLAGTQREQTKWIIAAIIFAGLLSAVRLLPPVLEITPMTTLSQTKHVLGYPSVSDLVCWMAVPGIPNLGRCQGGGWAAWEYDLYVGFFGVIFLGYFGVIKGLFSASSLPRSIRKLLIPGVLMALLTIGNWFGVFRATGIPFFAGERVISRMIAVPFFVFLLAAAVSFDQWVRGRRPAFQILNLFGLTFLANDLWLHSLYWSPTASSTHFPALHLDLSGNSLSNHADPIYFRTLAIGAAITVVTFVFLIVQSFRDRKSTSLDAS